MRRPATKIAWRSCAPRPGPIRSSPIRRIRRDDQTRRPRRQNVGYADHLRHAYWHFVDQPFSPDDTPLVPAPAPNVATVIPMLRAALAAPATSRRREVVRSRVAAAPRGRRPPAAPLRGALRRGRSQGRSRRQQRQDHRQRPAAGVRRPALLSVRAAGRAARVLSTTSPARDTRWRRSRRPRRRCRDRRQEGCDRATWRSGSRRASTWRRPRCTSRRSASATARSRSRRTIRRAADQARSGAHRARGAAARESDQSGARRREVDGRVAAARAGG